jgi:hypothetical protein
MRVIVLFLCLFLCLESPLSAKPAIDMRITMYADGHSCLGGCDAHVVFDKSVNGTRNAFRGNMSSRLNPEVCHIGEHCTVCFGESDNTCMTALYRGQGPHKDALDFTPAFFEANCAMPNLPAVFAKQCRSLSRDVERLRTGHINCFIEADNAQCQNVMMTARRAKEADVPLYNECKRIGQVDFNRQYPNQAALQRRHDCNYSNTIRRRNSSGNSWVVLMPAACRENTYVGRDGLDCCSSSIYAAAGLGRECSVFFPAKIQPRP